MIAAAGIEFDNVAARVEELEADEIVVLSHLVRRICRKRMGEFREQQRTPEPAHCL